MSDYYNRRLLEAIKTQDLAGIEDALLNGADIETKDSYKRTSLYIACGGNFDINVIKFLLINGASVRAPSGQYTPLHVASFSKNSKAAEVVRLLLEAGADVDAVGLDGSTALYKAASIGNPETVKILLAYGASNMKSPNGYTPLKAAELMNYKEVINVFHQHEQRKFQKPAATLYGNFNYNIGSPISTPPGSPQKQQYYGFKH